MTIKQISKALRAAGKPSSRVQVHRYLNACHITPTGARQRPQQYPEGTHTVILQHLGLVTNFPVVTAAEYAAKGPEALLKVIRRHHAEHVLQEYAAKGPKALLEVRAQNTGTAWKKRRPASTLPTMNQLRAERQKARGK